MPSIKTSKTTLPDPDKKMIALKYQSEQMGQMSEENLRRYSIALLLKIHVITGWVIDPDLKDILSDQFRKHLLENYPVMNVDEIEYAFRKKGTTTKDWGKTFNLALVDEVLIPYCEERMRLSFDLEERNTQPPPMKVNTEEEIDNFHRKWTEEFYQRIRSGQIENVPAYCQDILVKDGLMKEGDSVSAFFVNALNTQRQQIYAPINNEDAKLD